MVDVCICGAMNKEGGRLVHRSVAPYVGRDVPPP